MDSGESSKNSVKEPLLKQKHVKKVDQPGRQHRRNKSAEIKLKQERKEEIKKNECETSFNGDEMDGKPAFDRKKLSEARGVKLNLAIPKDQPQYPLPLDAPTPVQKPRNSREKTTPPHTSSPVGNILYKLGSAKRTAQEKLEMDTIDIRVFFSDGQGMEFAIEGGKLAEADFLLSLAAHQRSIGETLAAETFTLWMISPLLEIQLKPHHRPYEVRCQWSHLLKRFTDYPEDQCRDDDPAIIMRRNVVLGSRRELQLCETCPIICEILFEDARSAFLTGRYAVDCRTAAELAGFSMCAYFGPWNATITMDLVRGEMDDHIPVKHIANVRGAMVFGKAVAGAREMEEVLIKAWKSATDKNDARKKFVKKAQELPSYGAAFFSGHIERPSTSLKASTSFKDIKRWLNNSNQDLEILVGVNRGYLTVTDPAKSELLLVQPIEDCSWRRVDPDQAMLEEGAEFSLLLHFPEDLTDLNEKASTDKLKKSRSLGKMSENESPPLHSKLLQVFGPQSVMVDALMTSMLNLRKIEMSKEEASSPDTAGYSNDSFEPSSASSSEGGRVPTRVGRQPSMTKGHRMCLATFDTQGNCLKAQGSLKKVLTVV